MEGVKAGGGSRVARIQENGRVNGRVGYTDDSRMNGAAGAVTAGKSIYLGSLATVTDTEVLGIAGEWEEGYTVVKSDSQAAIRRCANLTAGTQEPRSRVDERVVKAAAGGGRFAGNRAGERL